MIVVVLDLDGTLWDHMDVSSMEPPFRRVSENTIVDSRGEELHLYPCVRSVLRRLREAGFRLAIASWNYEDKAKAALEALGIADFFDYMVIEYHPRKEEMLERIAQRFPGATLVFVDDTPEIVRRVEERAPWVRALLIGRDLGSICELPDLLGCP